MPFLVVDKIRLNLISDKATFFEYVLVTFSNTQSIRGEKKTTLKKKKLNEQKSTN